MESRFQSFEFKAYSSKLPEPSPLLVLRYYRKEHLTLSPRMMSSKISSKVLKKNVPMVLRNLLLTAEGNFCYLMRVFLRFIKHLSGVSAIDTSILVTEELLPTKF